LPDLEDLREIMMQRLHSLLLALFSDEGVLLEHSPGYQILLTRLLTSLVKSTPLLPGVADLIARAKTTVPWMIYPGGGTANLGDTHRYNEFEGLLDLSATPAREGPKARAFPKAGFFFVKGESVVGTSYLAQTAAFHSRVHKQADTGAFVWFDAGRDFLVDAGLFDYAGKQPVGTPHYKDGFWYSDPRRMYVESTRAHNTIEVNGLNHSRVAKRAFGSSLLSSFDDGQVFASETKIRNLPRADHVRLLALLPGEWLLCLDEVKSRIGDELEVRQWFQLAPDLRPAPEESALSFMGVDGIRLDVVDMTDGISAPAIARGVGNPEHDPVEALQGWWSPARRVFEPCTSLSFRKRGARVRFVTLFAVHGGVDRSSVHVRVNSTGRAWRVQWTQGQSRRNVLFRREDKLVIAMQ
jgi:hypothetical protein